jgi:glyoxylase-like metal-dependent hydrolase (beta-lactamase superfamily II)
VRVRSLHPDVILLTSRIWQTNCVVVRSGEEAFVIDSPILPDELEIMPSLLEQAGFALTGLLVTHADWDHLLAPLAFPRLALGCAQCTAARMRSRPGEPQRELRAFDESFYLARERPLMLGQVQVLPVPGHCEIGSHELELHPAEGHTEDGMSIWMDWAGVLVVGDYLSAVEIPALEAGGSVASYLATLGRLAPLAAAAEHIVPGHGPVLDAERALAVLEQDTAYLQALPDGRAELPEGRRTPAQRQRHEQNLKLLSGSGHA